MISQGTSGESGDEFALLPDINVTPFIDVMLVLLIIFMVTAPLLNKAIKVELPQAKAAQPTEKQRPVVVTVTNAGGVQVGDRETDLDGLVELVRAELAGEDRHIQVRGDTKADYGWIVGVLDRLASNGMTKIALITNRQREVSAVSVK